MKRFIAALATVATLAAATAGTVAPASADEYYRHHRNHNGDALGAGLLGLGVGALIGGAIAGSDRPTTYYEPAPRYYDDTPPVYYRPAPRYYEEPSYVERRVYYRPAPVYREAPRYQVRYDHVAACEARYRSYDRRTDTFIGNDGRAHYCTR